MLKVSIITVALNSAKTIYSTLKSVEGQDYAHIEHIIIDGNSTDATVHIAASFPHVHTIISESDKGIYDAINKGITLATGDIVGILNSDDYYPNSTIISQIVETFNRENCDATFGDICFVDAEQTDIITRSYSGKKWHPKDLKKGIMPPHPSLFIKKSIYDRLGLYDNSYEIAGDFDLVVRYFHKNNFEFSYIEGPAVYMRTGGISNRNLRNRLTLNREIIKACKAHGLQTSYFFIALRYFSKVQELDFAKISSIKLQQIQNTFLSKILLPKLNIQHFSLLIRYLVSFIPAMFL